jgi:hypothetical protein
MSAEILLGKRGRPLKFLQSWDEEENYRANLGGLQILPGILATKESLLQLFIIGLATN